MMTSEGVRRPPPPRPKPGSSWRPLGPGAFRVLPSVRAEFGSRGRQGSFRLAPRRPSRSSGSAAQGGQRPFPELGRGTCLLTGCLSVPQSLRCRGSPNALSPLRTRESQRESPRRTWGGNLDLDTDPLVPKLVSGLFRQGRGGGGKGLVAWATSLNGGFRGAHRCDVSCGQTLPCVHSSGGQASGCPRPRCQDPWLGPHVKDTNESSRAK